MKHTALFVTLMLVSLPALGQVAAVDPGTTGAGASVCGIARRMAIGTPPP